MTCSGLMKQEKNSYEICVGDEREMKRFALIQEAHDWPIFSDRSKLNGVLICLELVETKAEWKYIRPTVQLYCDNKALVEILKEPYMRKIPTWVDRRNTDLKI